MDARIVALYNIYCICNKSNSLTNLHTFIRTMGKISTQCYQVVHTAFTLSLPVYAGTDLILQSFLSFFTDGCSALYEVLATTFDVPSLLC